MRTTRLASDVGRSTRLKSLVLDAFAGGTLEKAPAASKRQLILLDDPRQHNKSVRQTFLGITFVTLAHRRVKKLARDLLAMIGKWLAI